MSAILESLNTFSSAGLTAVLNTLWLALGVAAVIWLALRLMPRVNAATRHAAWWTVLALVALMPFASLLPRRGAAVASAARTETQVQTRVVSSSPARSVSPHIAMDAEPPVAWRASDKPLTSPLTSSLTPAAPVASAATHASDFRAGAPPLLRVPFEFHPGNWPSTLLFLWIAVSCFLLGRVVLSYVHLRGLRRRARPPSADLAARFEQRLRDSRTPRAPQLLLSDEVISPLAAGFLRPVVILPDHLLEEIAGPELDYVLLHELAHIARLDDWTNLIGRLASAVFALHPVAAWVLHRIKREREIACDDWVVAASESAADYAATLARIFEFCTMRRRELLATEMAHPSSNLGERIKILLRPRFHFSPSTSLPRVSVCVVAGFALLSLGVRMPRWIAFAQDSTVAHAEAVAHAQISPARLAIAPRASLMGATASGATPFATNSAQSSATLSDEDKTWRHGWKLTRNGSSSNTVRLSLISRNDNGSNWMNNEDVPLSSLNGFTLSMLDHDGPVKFEYLRKTGRIVCEGQAAGGSASGPFTAVVDPAFASALDKMGYTAPRNDEAFSLVLSDVTLAYAQAIKDTGLTSSVSDLVDLKNHGVGSDYVHAVRQEGFTDLTAENISGLYDHGVQPTYLKAIKTTDPKLSIEEIDSLYDHGVKPDYYGSLKAASPQLQIEQIDSLYDHGVKPDAYMGLASTDPKLSIEDIDGLYDHGVKLEYYRSIKAAGPKLSIEQIDSLYDHGVKPDTYKGFASTDPKLSIEEIDHLNDHGVKTEYYRSIKAVDPKLSVEQIDSLYDHGVEPESYKGFASIDPNLSIEQIDSLHNHGVEPTFYQGTKAADSAVSIEEVNNLRDHGVEPDYLREMNGLPDRFSVSDISKLRDQGISAKYIRNLHDMGMKSLTADQIIHLRESN
jgi:beta-lactamase regulating signal transducer with metallopeptidase domain